MQEIRVRLRLPDDHPLLRFPQNKRSETVRVWLDLGVILADIKEELAATKDLLNAVEKRLAALEVRLVAGGNTNKSGVEEAGEGNQINQVDIDKFLSAFEL